MNAPFTQDARLGRLSTALGKDTLVLLRFDGADHVNDLFEYHVEALSAQANIDFDGIIGTHASVEIDTQGHGARAFDGIVTQARWAGVGENGHRYVLTLSPWIWIAGRRRNQRIFHNKTVVQIIEELLAPYAALGEPALEIKLTGDYPMLEYTVQYRESDLAFATRLMERFGISYHFTHALGSHTMVLTDAIDSHDGVAGGAREYKAAVGAAQTGREHFWEWHPERRMTTGAMRLTEYNFKTPHAAQEVDRVGDAAYAQGQIESYDWPGDYLNQGQGKGVVGLRTDQERGQDARHRAVGDCTSLSAGLMLTLTGDHAGGVSGNDYLCLTARHAYTSDAYGSNSDTATDDSGFAYTGDYVFMPSDAPLAPERKTHIPTVQGPQTATVVGEGEIDCDEYGRILVHFHWDLEKAYSMRCRVSQNWASKGWGGMVIPRIGMEVVVEFLEGDPDKPLVTGCVYNGANDPPYLLPKNKTISTFKTDTHKGDGYNELRFEDENGIEEIFLHAQKDLTQKIENNATVRIDANSFESVGQNRFVEVAGQSTQHVGGDLTISVNGANSETYATGRVGADDQGTRSIGYLLGRGKAAMKGAGNFMMNAVGGIYMSSRKSVNIDASADVLMSAGADRTDTVARDQMNQTRRNSNVSVGKNLHFEVGNEIEFRCGASIIRANRDGKIEILGSHIIVNGSRIDLN